MPFFKKDTLEEKKLIPGFRVRFVHGDTMTLAYWTIDKGAKLPEHAHPHEQICNVINGQFELVIDGEALTLHAGDVGVIPSQAIHAGTALTDCQIIDAFQPVREDYR
ncbi:MAG: cupin domain-containing protein [Verrucomicrobia bacterium]|jgi:quercetin dioxygenase-like cupin family protein|nr:cupin domain-containing protein [Verrucomicrobiota bacterium]